MAMAMGRPDFREIIRQIPVRGENHLNATGRPLVTLTYAQSLDGSIASRREQRLTLSSPETKLMTHQLRAVHNAILVGVGTVLADDPKLTARLVDGPDPQPIIIDSHLRTPLSAHLFDSPDHKPWLATTRSGESPEAKLMADSGAQILSFDPAPDGRVPLGALLDEIGARGISSLMVEGGAQIITTFLSQRLVDWVILTIAPCFVGGVRAVEPLESSARLELSDMAFTQVGLDLVLWGEIAKPSS
jgi:3,4-dihydroxy 2-butanone 4-phosphate synthase/GTP cyclohydrolase II